MTSFAPPELRLASTTRAEALRIVERVTEKVQRGDAASRDETSFMNEILDAVQERFLDEIRARQAAVPGLRRDPLGYEAVWGGDLTPGCRSCLEQGLRTIRSVSSCNLDCSFCYYQGTEPEPISSAHYMVEDHDRAVTRRDVKLMVDKALRGGDRIGAIAWVWFEPFVDVDKHPDLVAYLHERGIHQHMYTNGTLCTRENMKLLADAGLDELRFNLAATRCSSKVVETMSIARDLFPYVCVESPMLREYFDAFVAKRTEILATGVDHIHCAELHLQRGHLADWADDELYEYGRGYVSPMSSRRLTYDLMDLAVEEGWRGVTIHDCSNEVKFLRGVSSKRFGEIVYRQEAGLPLSWFRRAVERYDFFAPGD